MQTSIDKLIKLTQPGQEADAILRKCVHCGFCNATCPTYQLLGDELDGPRGRIYLIKQALEGNAVTRKTQTHLDRCLNCLACETTCPSGVEYHRLLDIGRNWVDQHVQRSAYDNVRRKLLRGILPYKRRFHFLLSLGQMMSFILPDAVKRAIPARQIRSPWPDKQHQRKMLVLDGCVQPSLAPNINTATARVLAALGISLVKADKAGCCGAVSWHLSAPEEARVFMRQNIDAWWPFIEAGIEAIVMTASGCGSVVKEYGAYLADDKNYAQKARRVSELTKDISEILVNEDLSFFNNTIKNIGKPQRVAFHAPCTLQHGQKITGVVETILQQAGYELTHVPDAHLCCGSAGTYSILQKDLSQQLLINKLKSLENDHPDVIVTMNIGCLNHLASGANTKVLHVVELLEKGLRQGKSLN